MPAAFTSIAPRGYILGIGTNIDPEINALRIVDHLVARFGRLLVSRMYYTEPVGMSSHHRFINYCAFAASDQPPEAFKACCEAIEAELGRNRARADSKTADRPADIDLLARLPMARLSAEQLAGADYLVQPAREIMAMLYADRFMPVAGDRLCVLPPLGDAPAAVDRDDRAGLVVIG
ncbi:MAG TPA: 2-amino-4-hydroxy-6-hydroxymethyldihydropteridine diphosphokinase [Xanthobacteraceae bacterium]|nr:2-amino-4-hydroxy-6-hydroxymethyldihydropteridine diphosphokinase [Xanthobacteraceae bacterium]